MGLNESKSGNVVIVGGGFAGVALAKRLERQLPRDRGIYLLSRENFITYNPLLPEVVGASILPGHVVAPLRQMIRRTRIHMVTVTDIDLENKRVNYRGGGTGYLEYDQLVLACGVDANLAIISGMDEHGLPLKTVGDALFLRNRVIERLEQATIEPDPERRRWLMAFIVVGGGFSGVEVAGELFDFLYSAVKYYKNVTREDCRVVVLEGGDRLLAELSASLAKKTLRVMARRGIEIQLNALALAVDDHSIRLQSGDVLEGGTVICTIGTAPQSLIVVGGGFSGVEVAGELFDFLYSAVKYYKNVTREDCRVVVLEGGDRLLAELSASLAKKTLRVMARRGIEIQLNALALAVDDHSIRLQSGDVLEGGTVICTIGTAPQSLTGQLPLPKERGRIQTNPDMSVSGFAGVWALGDCALVPNGRDGSVSPPTASTS